MGTSELLAQPEKMLGEAGEPAMLLHAMLWKQELITGLWRLMLQATFHKNFKEIIFKNKTSAPQNHLK